MEQYSSTGSQDTTANSTKTAQETKEMHSLESKLKALEGFVHSQGQDLLRLRREITRLKSDVEQLTNNIRLRG